MEEKTINEEYKVWKKNAPYLYDLVVTHSFEWPSLTIQWLPDIDRPEGKPYTIQRLLLGTHTSDNEPNFLQIATVQMPTEEHEIDSKKYDEDADEFGGFGAGGQCRINIAQRIPHEGEVNRARYMPQNPCVIATKAVSGEVLVFDYTKHASQPARGAPCNPDLRLVGHEQEGYGLAWSPHLKGHLIDASEDRTICLWDISAGSRENRMIQPKSTFRKHTNIVNDVGWNGVKEGLFCSAGDDALVLIWDARQADSVQSFLGHDCPVNCVAFNLANEMLLASGAADGKVMLWDLRKPGKTLHTIECHANEVLQIQWCPQAESVLASSSGDRRLNILDLSLIGRPQTVEDAEDGPPELLFIHGGHTNKIPDFGWNLNQSWVLASVAEDNICQVWQMVRWCLTNSVGTSYL